MLAPLPQSWTFRLPARTPVLTRCIDVLCFDSHAGPLPIPHPRGTVALFLRSEHRLDSQMMTPAATAVQAKMSSQVLHCNAPSLDPAGRSSSEDNAIARPSLNAWIAAVMAHGNAGQASSNPFAAPAPRKPSGSPTFKLLERESRERSVPTPRAIPSASAASAGGSICSAGGPAASPLCSHQRSAAMLGPHDRRVSEESIPGAFTPWQQPRQVGHISSPEV